MTITFRCEKCRKTVEAPNSAVGRRGKCPYCGATSYIPSPVKEEDVIPLAPVDETEERQMQQEIASLLEQERELLHDLGGSPEEPLEHKEDLRSEDLQHFVVNYCMDMFHGNLDRATQHIAKLKKFKFTAMEAVEDFQTGKAAENVLATIPKKVLQGFLKDLRDQLK